MTTPSLRKLSKSTHFLKSTQMVLELSKSDIFQKMTRTGPRIYLKVPCIRIGPKKVQKEVSQMTNCNLAIGMLLGGLIAN